MSLVLAERIKKETDLTGAIVYGTQRAGKSSYGLKVMAEVYGNYDDALKHTFFRISDIVAFLKNCIDNDRRVPCFMWDDVGVHGGANVYNTNRLLAHYVSSLFDVIGTVTKGVIFTTPNPFNLLKQLRGYEFYRVAIAHGRGKYDRIGHGYISKMLPSGTRRIYTEWDDHFDVRVPCYDKYYEMRKKYSIDVVSDLDQFIKVSKENPIKEQEDKQQKRRDYQNKRYHEMKKKKNIEA